MELAAAARCLMTPAYYAGFQERSERVQNDFRGLLREAMRQGKGLRWNDPAFGIVWPDTPQIISQRDAGYPDFNQ